MPILQTISAAFAIMLAGLGLRYGRLRKEVVVRSGPDGVVRVVAYGVERDGPGATERARKVRGVDRAQARPAAGRNGNGVLPHDRLEQREEVSIAAPVDDTSCRFVRGVAAI